jgi:hypothetical protein
MPKKKAVDENIVGVPNFEEMDDDELERQATILKLKKEWLAVAKESFTKLERERELCSISTALREFHKFLNPFRDFLVALPNLVQDIVPQMTPEQYRNLENEISEQTERLAANTLHLTLESTREEKDASTQIQRENQRRSNRINGRKREN